MTDVIAQIAIDGYDALKCECDRDDPIDSTYCLFDLNRRT
jgi:hypothetical protein